MESMTVTSVATRTGIVLPLGARIPGAGGVLGWRVDRIPAVDRIAAVADCRSHAPVAHRALPPTVGSPMTR